MNFNSRPSARGDAATVSPAVQLSYFNSRPSARGDREHPQHHQEQQISIHAPPRGATRPFRGREVLFRRISIHAPPRGATSRRPGVRASGKFQFTPLREGRRTAALHAAIAALFQFTPLREGRRNGKRWTRRPLPDFNSRPSARGDVVVKVPICRAAEISIHAPPRGATFPFSWPFSAFRISIHAPPRGATAMRGDSGTSDDISIHAPPRGATACRFLVFCGFPFQFTPLREGRQNHRLHLRARLHISIHAPPRGAT